MKSLVEYITERENPANYYNSDADADNWLKGLSDTEKKLYDDIVDDLESAEDTKHTGYRKIWLNELKGADVDTLKSILKKHNVNDLFKSMRDLTLIEALPGKGWDIEAGGRSRVTKLLIHSESDGVDAETSDVLILPSEANTIKNMFTWAGGDWRYNDGEYMKRNKK